MTDSQAFNKNALECERLAVSSPTADDRAAFKQMAAEWRFLEHEALADEAIERATSAGMIPH